MGRPKVSQSNLLAVKLKPVPHHIESALAVEHAGEAVEHGRFETGLMVLPQLVPGSGLGRLDEGEEV
jgi:hypothetical protein